MPQQPYHSYHFTTLDSTQTYLHQHPNTTHRIYCRADQQTAGHGQRGATWQSPQGGLYFSLRTDLIFPPATHSGLAQYIALTIAQTIDPTAQTIRLKWPNDLFIGEKKLGGILVETTPNGENTTAIIGVGINIEQQAPNIAYLHQTLPHITINTLYLQLIDALNTTLDYWNEHPYLPTTHRWHEYDRFANQTILLDNHPTPVTNLGIDQKGRLIIKHNEKIQFLSNTRIKT